MNLSALKTFAPEIRRQLLEAVGRKLDFVLSGDTADLRAAATQVANLREKANKDRNGLIEQVAYTWFNRFAALRFIDAHTGWHPFRCRVITPASTEETQPELLKLARTGAIPPELALFTDVKRLNDLLDGNIPSTDPQGEVYRLLILAACRFYHDLMPFLFEAINDETELLLPDDLLTEHSIVHSFRTEISDDDCGEVELIGWLYQFYISEKKDQVMARKSAVPSEDIPAVTQLFTPHWIVRYLVENSLGRLWLNSRPCSRLRDHMPYYIDNPEGQVPSNCLTVGRPEEIKLLDPAGGSGHMLTYAFDLLYRIYEEEGHAPSEIPGLILTHNLHGLDICPRAVQLAQFALVCKAREKSRTAFRSPIKPQIMCLADVAITPEEMHAYMKLPGMREVFTEKVLRQIHQFREDTSIFGSLIQPLLTEVEITALKGQLSTVHIGDNLQLNIIHNKIISIVNQSEMLLQRYHVVVTNPPYMGGKGMNVKIKDLLNSSFGAYKSDVFSAFIIRCINLSIYKGMLGFMTPFVWMFIASYEKLRRKLLSECTLTTLVQLEYSGFEWATVPICTFTFENYHRHGYKGGYIKLSNFRGSEQQGPKTLEAIADQTKDWFYRASTDDFAKIPGEPIAYWLGSRSYKVFETFSSVGSHTKPRQGMSTNDNSRFVRRWSEVPLDNIGFGCASLQETIKTRRKWFPYNKGGEYRRWFGNAELLVNWMNDGEEIKNWLVNNPKDPKTTHWSRRIINTEFYCKPGLSWTFISSSAFGIRYSDAGFLFDVAGSSIFPGDRTFQLLSYLSSNVAWHFLKSLNPTLNFQAGNIADLPWNSNITPDLVKQVEYLAENMVTIARSDWNNFESSWDFRELPFLSLDFKKSTLEQSWEAYAKYCHKIISQMQDLESRNNRIWIEVFELQNELSAEIQEDQITLARPDRRKDMAAFLSYAVGCMMGRYSLDHPGLILANAGDTLDQYIAKVGKPLDQLTFAPDEDGIIPILDGEWFEDDIVARTRDFLRATFGDATLEENIRFIEESLGKDLRKYFLTDFYKDHLQTYKKRPIYWLFQTPKKGFSALVYLHRYTKDTPNRLLSSYLRDFLHKLRSRLEHLDHELADTSASARVLTNARKESDQIAKTLRECEDWERNVLLPLAQKRIELDLDDGVKVNYLKLGEALATIPGLASKEED